MLYIRAFVSSSDKRQQRSAERLVDVIGFGALNLDRVYQVESLVADSESRILAEHSSAGGSAANTVYGLARLGLKVGFVGAIGDDEAGSELLADFRRAGVDTTGIATKKRGKSGWVLALVDKQGRRSLYVNPGANSLLAQSDIDMAHVTRARLLHLSSFLHDRQLKLQIWAISKLPSSVMLSFAPGTIYANKGTETLRPLLERANIIFLNRREIELLTGKGFAEGAQELLSYGCCTIVITFGSGVQRPAKDTGDSLSTATKIIAAQGVYKLSQDRHGRPANITAYIISRDSGYLIEDTGNKGRRVKDSTGAGDAFAAGFLYGLLAGKHLEDCGRLGQLVAGFSLSEMGARAGLPSAEELRQRYRECYGMTL